jgi:hypothetical protein
MAELSFAQKIRTLQFAPAGIRKDQTVSESRDEAGHRLKATTEGDPVNGTVTHTEHADSDRVDAQVAPATVAAKFVMPQVEAEQAITVTPPEEEDS